MMRRLLAVATGLLALCPLAAASERLPSSPKPQSAPSQLSPSQLSQSPPSQLQPAQSPASTALPGLASPGLGSPGTGSPALPSAPLTPNQAAPLAQLDPAQRAAYDAAVQAFSGERYAEAFATFRQVLVQLAPGTPAHTLVAKFASEAAINADDPHFAVNTLQPIAASDANDWQLAGLLARAYAETGQKEQRDSELAHLVDLHVRAVSPQIAKLQQVLLERVPSAHGRVLIWYALEPWGRYRTYLFARVYDQAGQQVLRVTLESSDFDQPLFAREHPELAAKGIRRFSLDSYGPDQKLPNGQVSQTHTTYHFYDGQPAYDEVKAQIIAVAEGKMQPASRTEH